MVESYFRGHRTIFIDGQWFYKDTMTRAGFGYEIRPCKKCGEVFDGSNAGEHDPCISNLPCVDNACCGNGIKSNTYIRFNNGVVVKGFEIDFNY